MAPSVLKRFNNKCEYMYVYGSRDAKCENVLEGLQTVMITELISLYH